VWSQLKANLRGRFRPILSVDRAYRKRNARAKPNPNMATIMFSPGLPPGPTTYRLQKLDDVLFVGNAVVLPGR
jgi:hypothetical protein